ncbi:MAG TPA: aminopeptidase [Clostridiales bacterium]|nr:aminopeptidase [Clostridiales bacterium]
MKDPRYEKLADTLINYSTELKKGEKILIETSGYDNLLARELVKKTYEAGGIPFVKVNDDKLNALVYKNCSKEQLEIMCENQLAFMKQMDAYLAIRESRNIYESSIIPSEKQSLMTKILRPVLEERVNSTKWCVMRYPNEAFAQLAGVSTDEFEDFYFNVCNLDYSKMSKAMDNLTSLMDQTDKVHLKGPGTDLTFSIKGIPAIKCDGKMNIPDGEVFTAPIRESVNGMITFNTPAVSEGFTYENIRFEFKDGKIIHATSNDNERINKKLDTDEGARYIGEFAIGVNPYILKPMKDTLFDEKIMGSIHFTPGRCYDEASNGNQSAIHWDLVMIQTPAYGGGEIYFDDHLVRKDGLFTVDELLCLNPENLK